MMISPGDVWFVYDGDCPICSTAASALQIKKAVGNLHLINAREKSDHPLMLEIKAKGLDLDEGMVIKFQNNYYHGANALHIMALLGTGQGWFNRMNAWVFKSKMLSRLCYPPMRGARNLALKLKGVPQIRNLQNNSQPIFQSIFGRQWDSLPPVMHKHYANRPYSSDVVMAEGTMKVEVSAFARLLSPILRITGALVPYAGDNIPVTVNFRSEPNSAVYCFDRIFHFPGKPPYHFRSRMVPVGENEVVEFMPIGIGWNASYRYDGHKVLIEHCGYKMKLFGKMLRLPLEWFFGKGYAEEEAISDDRFRMYMDIRHPVFGKVYAYSGEFIIKEMNLDR